MIESKFLTTLSTQKERYHSQMTTHQTIRLRFLKEKISLLKELLEAHEETITLQLESFRLIKIYMENLDIIEGNARATNQTSESSSSTSGTGESN